MHNSFRLEVMTPSKLFYRGEVEEVIATTPVGKEGFMAHHAWTCKLLDAGELWIREPGSREDEWKIASTSGGFIDAKDSVVIYTDAVEWSEDIDMERVLGEKAKAEDWLAVNREADENSEEVRNAKLALAKAETRTNVAEGGKRH